MAEASRFRDEVDAYLTALGVPPRAEGTLVVRSPVDDGVLAQLAPAGAGELPPGFGRVAGGAHVEVGVGLPCVLKLGDRARAAGHRPHPAS